MPHLSCSFLGPFQASLDGAPITRFESNRVRALLAYLAVEGQRAHAREALAALFWPDWPASSALSNLRYALSNLREAIGDRSASPPYLLINRDTIQFNPASPAWIDVAEFSRLAQAGPDADPEKLVQAADLYQGSFLEGLSLGDSAEFEEWATVQREEYRRRFHRTLYTIAARYEQQGKLEQAVSFARRHVNAEPEQEEAQQQLIMLLASNGQRSAALLQYESCRRVLKEKLGVEPAAETTALFKSIGDGSFMKTRPASLAENLEPPAPGEPPFKGLQYFEEADAPLFFGRQNLVARLLSRLGEEDHKKGSEDYCQGIFLAVIGASGSGKSSLVRAGLIPALKAVQPLSDGSTPPVGSLSWLYHAITPTTHPLEALAVSLTRSCESVTAAATLVDDLRREPRNLSLYLQKLLRQAPAPQQGDRVCLFIDQFEETFTLCSDEGERRAFIDALMAALSGPLVLILALRADIYASCAPYGQLRRALSEHQEYIGPMNAAQLRQAIEEPALPGGWILEPGLVDLFLNDIGATGDHLPEPGALPLLSHALFETWKRRRGRTLTLAGYAEAGGVRGAIANTAERVFAQLSEQEQLIARSIFLKLTELGNEQDGGGYSTPETRRRAGLDELFPSPEAGPGSSLAYENVLQLLVDARLVTTAQGTAEVAHEALIREWSRLRQWLSDNRDALRLQRSISEAALEWNRLQRDPGALLHGVRLGRALEWMGQSGHAGELTPLEHGFLDASREYAEREEAEREAQRQRELAAARQLAEAETKRAEEQARSNRRLRQRAYILAGVLGLTLLVVAAAIYFWRSASEQTALANQQTNRANEQALLAEQQASRAEQQTSLANQQASLATGRELTLAAFNSLQEDQERGILLALEAVRTIQAAGLAVPPETEDMLHNMVLASRLRMRLTGHTSTVYSAFYSPEGHKIVSASQDQTVAIWDAASGARLLTLPVGNPASYAVFSPDGSRIATGDSGGNVILWDAASGERLGSLYAYNDGGVGVGFSPDGTMLAVVGSYARAMLVEAATMKVVWERYGMNDLWFAPDGKLITTMDDGLKIWDWREPEPDRYTIQYPGLYAAAFSSDGSRLAMMKSDFSAAVVFNVAAGEKIFESPRQLKEIYGWALSPDGRYLATGGIESKVIVWDVESGTQAFTLNSSGRQIRNLSFSPDGQYLVACFLGGEILIWDVSPGGSSELFSLPGKQGFFAANTGKLMTVVANGTEPSPSLVQWDLPPGGAGKPQPTTRWNWAWGYIQQSNQTALVVSERTVRVIDMASGQEKYAWIADPNTGYFNAVAFSPDGGLVATTGEDDQLILWDITGKKLKALEGMGSYGVNFSPDGSLLVATRCQETPNGPGIIRMWDVASGTLLKMLSAHNFCSFTAFSPDGKRLLTAGYNDALVFLWDIATGQKLLTLEGHTGGLQGATFSPDGKLIATSGTDGTTRVWDAASGQQLFSLAGHSANVTTVSFSPDSRYLVSSDENFITQVYALQLDDLVQLARSRLTRTLTDIECQTYLHVAQCPASQ